MHVQVPIKLTMKTSIGKAFKRPQLSSQDAIISKHSPSEHHITLLNRFVEDLMKVLNHKLLFPS